MLDSTQAKPLVPWIGGKRKLAKHILPLPSHTTYVEPFCGAAAIYFAKPPSKSEVLNDVNGDITNLYRVVKHHLEELYKQFKWLIISRDNWDKLSATPVEVLTDIQRAARFLFMQKMAFGGKVTGQTLGVAPSRPPRFNMLTIEDDLLAAHGRLQRTFIESLDWAQCIERYDRSSTLFYCDPPYWQTEGYGVEFGWEQYVRLRNMAHSIKGSMIISINNNPQITELFGDMPSKEVNHTYTVGGGKQQQRVKELIYYNFTPNSV